MKDRGMKKYLPYKSLVEQEDFLNNVRKQKTLVKKPILLEDEENSINECLINLKKGDFVKIKYFQKGEILYFSSKFQAVDLQNHTINLEHKKIPLSDVLGAKKI